MLTDERVSAGDTTVLPISEMRLDVGLDVFFPPKAAVAVGVGTHPPAIDRVGTTDICCDFFGADAGIFYRGIDIQIGYRLRSGV